MREVYVYTDLGVLLEQLDSDKGAHIMPYREKGNSVLSTIMFYVTGQNPYSNMNNCLIKVVHIWDVEEFRR